MAGVCTMKSLKAHLAPELSRCHVDRDRIIMAGGDRRLNRRQHGQTAAPLHDRFFLIFHHHSLMSAVSQ